MVTLILSKKNNVSPVVLSHIAIDYQIILYILLDDGIGIYKLNNSIL